MRMNMDTIQQKAENDILVLCFQIKQKKKCLYLQKIEIVTNQEVKNIKNGFQNIAKTLEEQYHQDQKSK